MSRIGKSPVLVPSGVSCSLGESMLLAKGKLGELKVSIPREVRVSQEEGKLFVVPLGAGKKAHMLWGTIRSLLKNAVRGVSEGFFVNLQIEGVGYRAERQDNFLKLKLGYSHDVLFPIPSCIEISCLKPTLISVRGVDLSRVGQVASEILRLRKADPYKGRGIKKENQVLLLKEGKKK